MTASYKEIHYQSGDGLNLYARDYANARAPLAVLCLHGLTRNSADFAELCRRLHPRYRLIVPDQRGRGRSAYDPEASNYHPGIYVEDMQILLRHLGLQRVAVVGTSMGGIMAMMMAARQPQQVRAIVLNDIGPEVDPAGLARIKAYVDNAHVFDDWEAAADYAASINGIAFPDYGRADWLRFARNLCIADAGGRPRLAYDDRISRPINDSDDNAVPPDLWPLFDACAAIPTLLIRGEFSDILSRDCVAAMRRRKADLQVVEVPGRGHAPMLDEPAAFNAIAKRLQSAEPA